jgi:hypothetical protein
MISACFCRLLFHGIIVAVSCALHCSNLWVIAHWSKPGSLHTFNCMPLLISEWIQTALVFPCNHSFMHIVTTITGAPSREKKRGLWKRLMRRGGREGGSLYVSRKRGARMPEYDTTAPCSFHTTRIYFYGCVTDRDGLAHICWLFIEALHPIPQVF